MNNIAKRGRPVKQPVSVRIQNALGSGMEQIQKIDPDNSLVSTTETQDDYEFSRNNLHSLLKKGNKILDGMVNLAHDCESPRAYEVAGIILKVLIEGNRELLALQKDLLDIEKKTNNSTNEDKTPVTIQNAEQVNNVILEGTTMDVLEMLEMVKQRKKQKEIEGEILNG